MYVLFPGYLDHSITIPRGKALGGSSVINAMIYARGNKADFDKWASLGNPGWSYGDVLPYFKKSENAAFPNASSEYHGEGGDLNVEYSRIFDKLGQAFLDAQEKDLGRKILDYNGKDQMGFSIIQMNEIFGRRDSGGKAFINRARNRTNLHIVPNALITKILIHKANKKAYGVRYVKNGRIYFARANKEVILSAGVFNSPQLLMLSGIGPRWHLEHLGIQTVHDLPNVGENLWDHLIVNTQAFSINYTYVNPNETVQVEQYLDAKGSLTSPDNVQCIGYVSLLDGTDTVPDVEHVFHTSNPGSQPYEVYKNLHRYTRETYENIVKPTDGISQWSIHSVLLHPKSRGNVRLNSKSPYDFPLIDPKYFSSDSDVETLIRAIKDIIRIAETPSMQKYNSTIIKVSLPVCRVYPYGTDDFWRCMVINLADTVHHFGGTCKMGPADDQSSVVGPDLKVHGIQNLRVADCSVIPVSLSGHTNAPAYMIGEKASDIIKQHYGVLEKNKSSSSESSSSSSSESSSSERE